MLHHVKTLRKACFIFLVKVSFFFQVSYQLFNKFKSDKYEIYFNFISILLFVGGHHKKLY